MVFSSVTFIFLFLPLTMALHFAAPARLRDAVLLCASFAFYLAGEPALWWVVLASLLLNYAAGLLIAFVRAELRFALLAAVVALNVSLLFVFKYAHFALDIVGQAANLD